MGLIKPIVRRKKPLTRTVLAEVEVKRDLTLPRLTYISRK